jgi:hypothetical protein
MVESASDFMVLLVSLSGFIGGYALLCLYLTRRHAKQIIAPRIGVTPLLGQRRHAVLRRIHEAPRYTAHLLGRYGAIFAADARAVT